MTPPVRYDGRVVLITGGTRGLGRATAEVFARHGAQLVLTYKWGTADHDELRQQLVALGAPPPILVEADIAVEGDARVLLDTIKALTGRIDAFISHAATSVFVHHMDDYREDGFMRTLRSGAWPTFGYLVLMKEILGHYPRYVVTMSSDAPDRYTPGQDFVAAGKAVVETLTRYLAYRLRDDGVRINVVRAQTFDATAVERGTAAEFHQFLGPFVPDDWFTPPDAVGRATFALCSGLFDGVSGQTIMVDRGNTFADGISYLYERRQALGLE